MKKVICISAKAQHGKDTTATILKSALEERGNKVLIAHYADLVKYIAKEFFDWNGEKDEAGRTLLQHIGTDVVRTQRPDYWVDFIIDMLVMFGDKWDYVLIPDCRFPNEVDKMKYNFEGSVHIRVVRPNFDSPLTIEQLNHRSETALDDYPYDYLLINDSTVLNLGIKILELVQQIDK